MKPISDLLPVLQVPPEVAGREPAVTNCEACGKSWSDGRPFCDGDHCGRVSPHQPEVLRA